MPRSQEALARLVEKEGVSDRVVEAFRRVAREHFVPKHARREAYSDYPVGIPERQTTSQPSLIARMIDALELEPTDKVLEVGTGYGFQTALLSTLAREVVSIERFEELAQTARSNLAAAGIEGVEVVVGDGWKGVPARAPFDAIVVSAAAREVPSALEVQLKEGGRLVIPLSRAFGDDVILFRKQDGDVKRMKVITPAQFVPLVEGEP
ncbi:MAG: protein-L-isoaspartate(D-aspartate) O-methyltransferase [Actinomycetota bacterium]|nr:protein-L-isoaspartate(D-aspartate) O-methyltransferase [Actinomycetota bacterium]